VTERRFVVSGASAQFVCRCLWVADPLEIAHTLSLSVRNPPEYRPPRKVHNASAQSEQERTTADVIEQEHEKVQADCFARLRYSRKPNLPLTFSQSMAPLSLSLSLSLPLCGLMFLVVFFSSCLS
jgi:hypothetical protein